MRVWIDEKEISRELLDEWRLKRIKRAAKTLKFRYLDRKDSIEISQKKWNEYKISLGYSEMLRKLKFKLAVSTFAMKLAAAVSRGRKTSVTVIRIPGVSAREVSDGIEQYMTVSSEENHRVNLAAYPEHYILKPTEIGMFEVVETPGNSPLPIRFFIEFGDERGLITPRDTSYQFQSTGAAKLMNGTMIGGVRHQFKDADGGCEVRLAVEFPSATPNFFVRAHQWHLACEFSYWCDRIAESKRAKLEATEK